MDAWLIVLIVLVVLALLVVGFLASQRSASRQKQEAQAKEHLNEARVRQARADSARAAADEQAARLRRERAELEQRVATQEREAAQLTEDADREQAKAADLQERARKLAPHLAADDPRTGHAAYDPMDARLDSDGDGRPDGSLRERVDRDDQLGYAPGTVQDSHAGRPDAVTDVVPAVPYAETTDYRTADTDGTVRDSHAGTRRDSDGDGRPDTRLAERTDGDDDRTDQRQGGLSRLKDRLTGNDRDPDRDHDGIRDDAEDSGLPTDDSDLGRHRR